MGRVDDVVNVAGHRLGTAEVESALVAHKTVAEAAVVGRPDEIKGSALVAFVTLKQGWPTDENLKHKLREYVSEMIGPIAKPDDIRFTDSLPKTRSGNIRNGKTKPEPSQRGYGPTLIGGERLTSQWGAGACSSIR